MCDYLAVEHKSNPYTRFLFYAVNDIVEHTDRSIRVFVFRGEGSYERLLSSFLPNLDLVVLEACISLFPDMLDNVHLC